ncbi:MAG: QueT transporter family protein [Synergistaceae bacterium]|nr:QueT transporter family protein [Synergistaceae bacterium]
MMLTKVKSLALGGMIAALYAGITIALAPISYGPVQFRVGEALTLLPFYIPAAVPGLFAGCLVANYFSPYGMLDMVVGSLATLAAAYLSSRMPRLWLAALPPVLVNGLVIGTMLHLVADLPQGVPLWSTIFYVSAGQAVVCALGIPLMKMLEKHNLVKR